MTRATFATALALLACVPACRRDELTGPPALRLGRDECAECGMLLSEDRCAAAMLVSVDGERVQLVFDDIGCLLDYGGDPQHPSAIETYVRDYAARQWVAAGSAWFVAGGASVPRTPMGSGIVAFGSREAADAQSAQSGGEVGRLEAVREARRREHETGASGG